MDKPKNTYSDKDQSAINAQNELDNRLPEDCLEWSDDDWKMEHAKLKNLPYLTPFRDLGHKIDRAFYEVARIRDLSFVSPYESNASIEMVDPRSIVGTPTGRDWSNHCHSCLTKESQDKTESSIVEIGRKIVRKITPLAEKETDDETKLATLDDIYNKKNARFDGVKLQRINGPRGPIYMMNDGTHRTSAAKLVGLKKIWASVGGYEPEKEIELWFEALREMPEDSKNELMRIYNLVYPPTQKDLIQEKKHIAEAKEQERGFLELKMEYDVKCERRTIEMALKYSEEERLFNRAERIYAKLENNPIFRQIRNEEALEHIKEYMEDHPDDSFHEVCTFEMTSRGWLLDKNGKPYIPVTGYDVGRNSHSWVLVKAVNEYERRYPDRIAELEMYK